MANSTGYFRHYSLLHIKPHSRIILYFKTLQKFLRCPICQGDARIQDEFLTCDHCHRGWRLQDLLYPIADNGPATSSGPASGGCHTPAELFPLAQLSTDPTPALGCANSFLRPPYLNLFSTDRNNIETMDKGD